MGDLNTKLGAEPFVGQVAGLHSLHRESNDNGVRLCNLVMSCGLWIGSISFSHKEIYKQTWKIPGDFGANQIDHFLVDRRHASSILDVRNCRDAHCDSDHFLIRARLRQRIVLIHAGNKYRSKPWNMNRLTAHEDTKESYQRTVENNLRKTNPGEGILKRWS